MQLSINACISGQCFSMLSRRCNWLLARTKLWSGYWHFPYMQCVRFLWDYLSGDKYWKCQYPDHNFVRANNQLHLLLSIERHYPEMKEFINSKLK